VSRRRREAATNLASPDWQAIATNVFNADGSATFIDTNATNHPHRFYRAVTR